MGWAEAVGQWGWVGKAGEQVVVVIWNDDDDDDGDDATGLVCKQVRMYLSGVTVHGPLFCVLFSYRGTGQMRRWLQPKGAI